MAHVGVDRLCARDGEEDGAEREEPHLGIVGDELRGIRRRDGPEDAGVGGDLLQAQRAEDQEPDHHDRPEQASHRAGAEPLEREQGDQDHQRERDDLRGQSGRRHVEPGHGRHHRDGRRQHAVAVEERRAEHADDDEAGLPARLRHPVDQGNQRHDAALAVVVDSQDQEHVLQRDDHEQRPDDQRQRAVDAKRRRRHRMVAAEDQLDRVERARADVAVDDAQRAERERERAPRADR